MLAQESVVCWASGWLLIREWRTVPYSCGENKKVSWIIHFHANPIDYSHSWRSRRQRNKHADLEKNRLPPSYKRPGLSPIPWPISVRGGEKRRIHFVANNCNPPRSLRGFLDSPRNKIKLCWPLLCYFPEIKLHQPFHLSIDVVSSNNKFLLFPFGNKIDIWSHIFQSVHTRLQWV